MSEFIEFLNSQFQDTPDNFLLGKNMCLNLCLCSLVHKQHLCPHLTKLFVTYTYLRKFFQEVENQPNVGYSFITSQLTVGLDTLMINELHLCTLVT